jgi:hypothetical protein
MPVTKSATEPGGLREVLGRIADHPINRIGQLLPWNIVIGWPVRAAA